MQPSLALKNGRQAVLEAAARHGATNVRIFGSVARGEDSESSDLDLLVDVRPNTSLLDLVKLQHDIEDALGIPVDVLTAEDLPAKVRAHVLATAQRI